MSYRTPPKKPWVQHPQNISRDTKIVEMRKNGKTYKEIASVFDLCTWQIGMICHNYNSNIEKLEKLNAIRKSFGFPPIE